MNLISSPAARLCEPHFDSETLALLETVADGIEISEFDVDLDVAFGTPLEMHELWATPREAAALKSSSQHEVLGAFFARRHAALDILADDPTITDLVRERLVDVLLPHAAQLRIARPAAAPLPVAA